MARYRADQLTEYVQSITTGTIQALFETAQAIFEALKEPGSPIVYPVQWDSERQKRAYFATDGFGSGIPYQRTNLYVMSGSVTKTAYGARLFKPHPAGAIGGTLSGWQSRIHRGRWKLLQDVIAFEVGKLPQTIRDKIRVEQGKLHATG